MHLFARCFLLFFSQIYVGGMLALAIPPFHHIERGFFKSTGGVYLGFGAVALLGRVGLWMGNNGTDVMGGAEIVELGRWGISVAAGAIYLSSLWGDAFALRARAYAVCWSTGLLALAIGSQAYRLAPAFSLETLLYPLNFIVSAMLLGAVATGMMLGHWYLIDLELSIEPFRAMLRYYIGMLAVQPAAWIVSLLFLLLLGSSATSAAAGTLMSDHSQLLWFRLGLSPMAAAVLAWMIWRTLKIPQTMAATGLFYVAILAVFVGEMMGRFILFRTQLPF